MRGAYTPNEFKKRQNSGTPRKFLTQTVFELAPEPCFLRSFSGPNLYQGEIEKNPFLKSRCTIKKILFSKSEHQNTLSGRMCVRCSRDHPNLITRVAAICTCVRPGCWWFKKRASGNISVFLYARIRRSWFLVSSVPDIARILERLDQLLWAAGCQVRRAVSARLGSPELEFLSRFWICGCAAPAPAKGSLRNLDLRPQFLKPSVS